jgi:hypothetical protein
MHDGQLFVVMEQLEGERLRERLVHRQENKGQSSWLGVRDDFRPWLIRAA